MKFAGTTKLLIIGDSIALGAAEVGAAGNIISHVQKSYVDRLRETLPRTEVIVEAEAQRRTATVVSQIDGMLARHRPDIVLLNLGGSDADVDWKRFILSEGRMRQHRTPPERYAFNLRVLAERVLAASALPIFFDFPEHDLSIRGPYISKMIGRDIMPLIQAGGGQMASDARSQDYRQILGDTAKALDLPLVICADVLAQRPSEVYSADGVHPNDEGHRLLALVLLPVLLQAILGGRRPGMGISATARYGGSA
jgi:lysophospholipase L1-like esterase